MRTLLANTPDLWRTALQISQQVLTRGGLVVFPSDTGYVLGANALDPSAVERVFALKDIPRKRGLPVVIGAVSWATALAHVSEKQEEVLKNLWPGNIAIVLSARAIVPDAVTSTHSLMSSSGPRTVSLRVPDHPFVEQLLKQYGYPIIAEEVDVPNDAPPVGVDLFVDLGTLPPSEPSTILDLSGDKPRILRVGATTPAHLLDLLKI